MKIGVTAALLASMLAAISPTSPTRAELFDGRWQGSIECSGSKKPWVSTRTVTIDGADIVQRKGEPDADGYEVWTGVLSPSGDVVIRGHYLWGHEKPLWFKGYVKPRGDGDLLVARGVRGPRTCSIALSRTSDSGNSRTRKP